MNNNLKQMVVNAFTAWPSCIATYVTIAGIIALFVINR